MGGIVRSFQKKDEQAKKAVSHAVVLGQKLANKPFKLKALVSDEDVAYWSLWQQGDQWHILLGFWSQRLPPSVQNYNSFGLLIQS